MLAKRLTEVNTTNMSARETEDIARCVAAGEIDPRDCPIPTPSDWSSANDYRQRQVTPNLVDDELVNLLEHGIAGVSYYRYEAASNPIYGTCFTDAPTSVLVRASALPSLLRADSLARRYNAKLFVMDGFRPLKVQGAIRDAFIDMLLKGDASLTRERAIEEADKYYSRAPDRIAVDDHTTWYAHCTGGALDVILVSARGAPMEFGGMFDDIGQELSTDFYEKKGGEARSRAAQRNRRLLFWVMLAASWVNYPYEYFHFDLLSDNFRTQFGLQNAESYRIKTHAGSAHANVGPADEQT